jgi:hypothetical protein
LQLKTREELFSIAHKRFSKPVISYKRKKTLRNTIELKKLNIGYSFNYRRMRRGIRSFRAELYWSQLSQTGVFAIEEFW